MKRSPSQICSSTWHVPFATFAKSVQILTRHSRRHLRAAACPQSKQSCYAAGRYMVQASSRQLLPTSMATSTSAPVAPMDTHASSTAASPIQNSSRPNSVIGKPSRQRISNVPSMSHLSHRQCHFRADLFFLSAAELADHSRQLLLRWY